MIELPRSKAEIIDVEINEDDVVKNKAYTFITLCEKLHAHLNAISASDVFSYERLIALEKEYIDIVWIKSKSVFTNLEYTISTLLKTITDSEKEIDTYEHIDYATNNFTWFDAFINNDDEISIDSINTETLTELLREVRESTAKYPALRAYVNSYVKACGNNVGMSYEVLEIIQAFRNGSTFNDVDDVRSRLTKDIDLIECQIKNAKAFSALIDALSENDKVLKIIVENYGKERFRM